MAEEKLRERGEGGCTVVNRNKQKLQDVSCLEKDQADCVLVS